MVVEKRKEDRSFLIYFLLTGITCGIYGIIFNWKLYKDINIVCNPKEGDAPENSPNYLVYVLLTMITCGIYSYVWHYKQGNRIQRVGEAYGVRIDESGSTLLLWNIFGVLLFGIGPLVSYYFIISNMNKLCIRYNREYANEDYYDNGGVSTSYSNGYGSSYGGGSSQRTDSYSGSYNQNNGYMGTQQVTSDIQNNYQNTGYYNSSSDNATQAVNPKPALPDYGNTGSGSPEGSLVGVSGELAGASIPLHDRDLMRIGRDPKQCNLILNSREISRKHCDIQFIASEQCYYVTDYSSLGVRLNGTQRLSQGMRTKCPRGSHINLGDGQIEFLLK